jgi:cell division protein FtsZ
VIIGAITDPTLEGKIRVSIVATSLDDQQPESKSVVNMVHRIQNRNTGYSDFSNIGTTSSFNFSSNNMSPISHGANALKLENEITSEVDNHSMKEENIDQINNQYHEELLKNHRAEDIVENTSDEVETSFTQEATNQNDESFQEEEAKNDLKEFGVDSEAPDLFNLENEKSSKNDLIGSENEEQEDDLEIPAFLRRQKN